MRLQQLIAMLPTERVSMIDFNGESDVLSVAEACQFYLRERQKSKKNGAKYLRSLRETLTL